MNETTFEFEQELQELSAAEEFLDYFGIQYDAKVVQVNRLHILQRFHDYLERENVVAVTDEANKRQLYARWLEQAYQDFVHSDAQTEKVFKVFQRQNPQEAFISVEEIRK
jgi:nitrogenase-stabilizing/protective protein